MGRPILSMAQSRNKSPNYNIKGRVIAKQDQDYREHMEQGSELLRKAVLRYLVERTA